MRKTRPAMLWIAITLLIAVICVLTWQAVYVFASEPVASNDPDALTRSGLAIGFSLGAIWLFEGLPAILALSGSRICRLIVTIAAAPGLLAVIIYRQPAHWGLLLISLKAIQLVAIVLLYIGPNRAFFQDRPAS